MNNLREEQPVQARRRMVLGLAWLPSAGLCAAALLSLLGPTGLARAECSGPSGGGSLTEGVEDVSRQIEGCQTPPSPDRHEPATMELSDPEVSLDPDTLVPEDAASTEAEDTKSIETEVATVVDEHGNRWHITVNTEADGRVHYAAEREDGTVVTGVIAPDGTEHLMVEGTDGSIVTTTRHPDGTVEMASTGADGDTGFIWIDKDAVSEGSGPLLCFETGSQLSCGRGDVDQAYEHLPSTPILKVESEFGEQLALLPDGFLIHTNGDGVVRQVEADADGGTVTTYTSPDGSQTVVRRDADGEVTNIARESGETYEPGQLFYEKAIGGARWEELSQTQRDEWADQERSWRERAAAQHELALQRTETDRELAMVEARMAYEAEQSAAQARERYQDYLAAQEAYRQAAEERRTADERMAAIREYEAESRRLEEARREALQRDDPDTLKRIDGEHDELHRAMMESGLLEPTTAERADMARTADVRQELRRMVDRDAHNLAYGALEEARVRQAGWEDLAESRVLNLLMSTPEAVKGVQAEWESSTRMQIMADARIQVIDRIRERGDLTPEQRRILQQTRDKAADDYTSAARHSRAMNQIVGAAVAFDIATTFLPAGKLGTAASAVSRRAAGAAAGTGAEAARRQAMHAVAPSRTPAGVPGSPPAVSSSGGPKALGRGSTARLSAGTTLPRTLREQIAVEQAMANPTQGTRLPLSMGDPRWPGQDGWVKMQQIVPTKQGMLVPGKKGKVIVQEHINVHYVYNTITGAVDDFKIVLPGPR